MIREGRVKRVQAGSEEAELRLFMTVKGVRSPHAFDYPNAHRLNSTGLETQIHEAEPFQPNVRA